MSKSAREKVRAYIARKTGQVMRKARKTEAVRQAPYNWEWRFTTGHHAGREKNYGEVYIYGLADPRDHVIRYVGKTVKRIEQRIDEHLEFPTNALMAQWLNMLRKHSLRPEGVAIEICAPEKWESAERRWIARLRKLVVLLNIEDGGDSRSATCSCKYDRDSAPVRYLSREEIAALNDASERTPTRARMG